MIFQLHFFLNIDRYDRSINLIFQWRGAEINQSIQKTFGYNFNFVLALIMKATLDMTRNQP